MSGNVEIPPECCRVEMSLMLLKYQRSLWTPGTVVVVELQPRESGRNCTLGCVLLGFLGQGSPHVVLHWPALFCFTNSMLPHCLSLQLYHTNIILLSPLPMIKQKAYNLSLKMVTSVTSAIVQNSCVFQYL